MGARVFLFCDKHLLNAEYLLSTMLITMRRRDNLKLLASLEIQYVKSKLSTQRLGNIYD